LIHRPPEPEDPLGERFSLAFAGHTHGGQIRLPGPQGWFTPHRVDSTYVQGVHRWGRGLIAVSRGVGTTFLPLRLFTRPEVVLYRLIAPASDSPLSGIHMGD
jgi:predicted MPP superfamily phosphohydrolase